MQIYRGSLSISAANPSVPVTVTLPTPVPVGKSFPLISFASTLNSLLRAMLPIPVLKTEVDGYYTELEFHWESPNNPSMEIEWQVVTGIEFTVQSGETSITNSLTATATIDEIDTTKTFLFAYPGTASSSFGTWRAIAYFSSNAEITFARRNNDANNPTVVQWYAVTMEGARVQSGVNAIAYNATTATVNISEVDTAKAFLLFHYDHYGQRNAGYTEVEGKFNSATQVNFQRGRAGAASKTDAINISWFVVEHDKITVQAAQESLTSTTEINIDITDVDSSRSIAIVSARNPDNADTDSYPMAMVKAKLSDTALALQRLRTGGTTTATWFVVEWIAALPPDNLKPSTSIMPDEANVFIWTTPEKQTDYEIEYREVGAATWEPTGKIESEYSRHIFPAYTFVIGKDYEWRVRYWVEGEIDPSDFSQPVQFDTYRPVIQNPTPYPDGSVRVEIRDFGAKLKSPYQRDIQLTILISDNPDFTSPTVYSLPEVASGEVATVQHAFQLAGYWYVRMVATDTESLQTVLEYQIFVSHQLFFKEPPEVTTHAPRATHVTVRVRGTTTEFTAVVTPPPPLESRIERLIMIDSGDQATCQAVAERLLEKWGRPQVSIKGTIPLTLVLRPRQKVRIVIPEVGLNEDLVLQRRQHVIEGVQAYTQITVGDIQLSESELVARTIDALERAAQTEAYLTQTELQTLGVELTEQEITSLEQGQELSEREIADIEQGQRLSDTDITVIEMGGDDAID